MNLTALKINQSSFDTFTISFKQKRRDTVFGYLTKYDISATVSNTSQKLSKYMERFNLISSLEYNWDGHKAVTISQEVIDNTKDLLRKIPDHLLVDLGIEDIVPSPYGTIVIETEKGDNEINIEIGKNEFSYFANIGEASYDEEEISFSDLDKEANEIAKILKGIFA